MTNKPTWAEEFDGIWGHVCMDCDGVGVSLGRELQKSKQFISTKLAERDEQWAKWKVLAEAMDNAPVGHRVTIKHLLGEDEWTLTKRNKTN